MKIILIVFLTLLTSFFVSSQEEGKYDDLVILFADAKYEKLIKTANKYSEKDANKKDVEPYLMMAKAYYKISLSGTMDPEYKNSYKYALKYLAKAKKYDKDSSYYKKEQDFIVEFQESVEQRMLNDLEAEDFRKAAGWAQKYSKITHHPVGAQLLVASGKYRSGDKTGAKNILAKCDHSIAQIDNLAFWIDSDVSFFKHGVIQAAECYVAARQLEKAQQLLNTVKVWYLDDEEFNLRLEEILN